MKYLMKIHSRFVLITALNAVLLSAAALTMAAIPGCGGGAPQSTQTPPLSGNTSVTILSTSTANDQLSQFDVILNYITLTSSSGSTVNLITTPTGAGYLNGNANGMIEPLLTVNVPQGTYTSATASVGSADFICVGLDPAGGLATNVFGYGNTPTASINLPAPITISGATMQLTLNLQVTQSAGWGAGDCTTAALSKLPNNFSITPTFNLTASTSASKAIKSANVMAFGLHGLISSVNVSGTSSGSFNVNAPSVSAWHTTLPGPNWMVNTSANTIYQGVSDFSHLNAGMPVDIDAEVQADGSLLATRVAIYDTNTNNLSAVKGPLEFISDVEPAINVYYSAVQGSLPGVLGANSVIFDDNAAMFQISGQLANLQSLPFVPSFTAASMVAGQDVIYTTHALDFASHYPYSPLTTVTLIPQTLDGTVSAISSDGNFTTYTITLAPYDLFPALAVQPGQTTLLTNPSQVVVYADDSTQMLNTNPIAVGSVVRFYGLVFNDNGTLRMDCAQINDGVPE
jgi:hypothetical protein